MSKNNGKSKFFYKILFVIFLIIFIVSCILTINILFIEPYLNNKKMDEIHDIYYKNDPSTPNENPPEINLDELLAINKDIKGWIKINNTPIDYPVLYSDYYLYRDYKKNDTKYGSIFLDNICIIENSPKNILIHGHHMNNGSMFAKICNYRDLNFYKENPVFKFDSIIEKGQWKVISAFITNTNPDDGELFYYLQSDFKDKSSFLNYVHKVRLRSNINTPVDVNEDDKLITLSTCSYEMKDFRTVVVARKVRENEDVNVDVSLARYNNNPLYPDAYHQKIRSAKPLETTFEEALKNNQISWYKK